MSDTDKILAPERREISFSAQELGEFVYGGIGFAIISDEIFDHRRWSVEYEMVIRRDEDETYWRGRYSVGATEDQYYDFEDQWGDRAVFKQVFPQSRMVTVYE